MWYSLLPYLYTLGLKNFIPKNEAGGRKAPLRKEKLDESLTAIGKALIVK